MRFTWLVGLVLLVAFSNAGGDPKRSTKSTTPAATAPKTPRLDVRTLMDARTLRRAGLEKLTEAELEVLNQWVTDLALDIYKRATPSRSRDAYAGVIVSAANDETFIIETSSGRDVFKARTYCFGISDGDEVVFQKSPGVCTSNTFVTRSGKSCDVWCE